MVHFSSPPILLPPTLEEIRQEVEQRARTSIRWEYDPTLEGEAAADFDGTQPVIRYRSRPLSLEAVAEELLHLKLTLSGHPRLVGPPFPCSARHAMVMLDAAVQHCLIYPRLIAMGMGFNPYEGANRAVSRQLERLKEVEEEFHRIATEPDLCAHFAMVYVRSKLECDAPTLRTEADSIFAHPQLQPSKIVADRVVEIIQTQDVSRYEVAKATLQECLSVLGLDNEIAVGFYLDW